MPGLPAGVDRVIFDDLKERYEAGQLVVFAGAGVSAAAGLPMWKRLGELLVERMRALGKPAADVTEAEGFVAKGDLIAGLSAARLSLSREFDIAVARHLDDTGKDPPEVAHAIAALAPKLAGVVTTNLDHFVEDALGRGWRAITKPVDDLVTRTRFVFKAHGTLEDPETWVFVRDEYDHVMFGSTKWLALFDALYRARTLLFVGASLTDDDFGITLGRIRALAGRNAPKHYAILPGPIGPARRDQLERAGIRLMVYENQSGNHREVVDILRALAGTSSVQPTPVTPPANRPPANRPSANSPPAMPAASAPSTPGPASALAGTVTGPVHIYISAAAADAAFLEKLVSQLVPLERAGLVRVSHAGRPHVNAGDHAKQVTGALLSRARILLPLLSADYSSSPDHEQELSAALKRWDAGTAVVIPILVRPHLWDVVLDGRDIGVLPANKKPLSTWSNIDAALAEVVGSVKDVATRLQKKGP